MLLPTRRPHLPRLLVACLGVVCAGAALPAQRIRGTVTQAGGDIPVPAALVIARDSLGREVARATADSAGRFDVALPAPGSYRLAALRIGFRLVSEAIVPAARGETAVADLHVGAAIAQLDPVQVRGRSSCSGDRAAAGLAADYWEQARIALAAVDPMAAAGAPRATVVTFDETVDPATDSLMWMTTTVRSGGTVRPFAGIAPDSIARTGFVRSVGHDVEYYAPDAAVMFSAAFASAHCFQAEPAAPARPAWVGIRISPANRSSGLVDVAGTLWLDRTTSRPRRLDFAYTGVSDDARRAGAGGGVEFADLADGRTIVARWWIRMPQLHVERTLDGVGIYRRVIDHVSVANVRVTGGEVVSVQSGADTIFRTPGRVLVVKADGSGAAPAGATVELLGRDEDARLDATGVATLPGVLPGNYRARVTGRQPRGASDVAVSVRGDHDTTVVRVALAPAAAEAPAAPAGSGTITGRVLRARDSLPLGDALVTVDGTNLAQRTWNDGTFRIAGVPAGEHAVRVARVGYHPLVVPEVVNAGANLLDPLRLIDLPNRLNAVEIFGVRRDIPPGLEEVYRRGASGLGRFFTREDIVREHAFDVKSVFNAVPGVYWNDQGIGFSRCMGGLPSDPRATGGVNGQGQPPKVQVYVDGTKVTHEATSAIDKLDNAYDVIGALRTININSVQAIELYTGVAQIPAEFLSDACAVIAIWTRRY
ncbi:MAG: carboxypeptidase-like regulatory domain-containing protein [Gemmatimonadota bacterium]|nr:carboxypeptidase-like regulatory domain-containing protein [Gemmatimonadota bacterium]